ncbi:MAG: aminotransferase class I/II-fold pyridoxal phosphate-dependent enzyme [Clostridia bacterium]
MKYTQENAPILEAITKHRKNRVVRFDVPGHKGGRGNKEIRDFLGKECLDIDVNSMKPLDNLCHPTSVIKDAQDLAAKAFGAAHCKFMVNGSTAGVQAMIMYACKAGDKIIMPRNVHRSAINILVVCGAVPVYVNPGVDKKLGIPLGMSVENVKKAIKQNPDAKAILINNPTYYGVCSNLKEIVEIAHEAGILVLCDEAHGTHFYFGEDTPLSAMAAGADLASLSVHKTGGSLTQSAMLLANDNVNIGYLHQVINLTQTTSASYLLMTSLDTARKNLSLHGDEIVKKMIDFAEYAREEINKIGGYHAFASDVIDGDAVFDFDKTKLSIHTRGMGLAGIEVYDILRDEYDIQIEFGDLGNILAIISAGDRPLEIERLVSALTEIYRKYRKNPEGMFDHEYIEPIVKMSPNGAFYAHKKSVEIDKSVGEICAEFLMCYPPGIPILAPGEQITQEIIDYIKYAKIKGCLVTGPEDMEIKRINVVEVL